jgi:hypothetical protein
MAALAMTIFYQDKTIEIRLGDEITCREGWISLYRTFVGVIVYVPGVSPFNHSFREDELDYVGVDLPGRSRLQFLVDPRTNSVGNRSLLFVRRGELNQENWIPGNDTFTPDN